VKVGVTTWGAPPGDSLTSIFHREAGTGTMASNRPSARRLAAWPLSIALHPLPGEPATIRPVTRAHCRPPLQEKATANWVGPEGRQSLVDQTVEAINAMWAKP
jgi:hypothetical protein